MEFVNEILDDYSDYCRDKLMNEFGTYSHRSYDPIYLYQRYKCRLIEKRKRNVMEAIELCVPPKFEESYNEIVSDIEAGNPLKKYQSRKLKTLDYDDDMLSHWGIQHFHLGKVVESDGFVKRTEDLLFIHFSQDRARIMGFFDHNSWCDLNLIQILHNNWPEVLTIFSTNSGMRKLNEGDYKTLRKKSGNANVVVSDGTEYMNPGLGVTVNGAPILAVLNSDKVIYMFNQEFELIKENIELILQSDPNKRKSDRITVGLVSIHNSDDFAFKIKETGFVFKF